MKYIDAELLKTELKRRIKERDNKMKLGIYFSTSYVYEGILDLIDSLQQAQPIIEEDWVEKRKQECWCRRLSNGNYYCERYEGVLVPCDGRCSWIVDYPKLKELKERIKQPDVDLEKTVEFDCIGKKVKMTVQELINYYIDSECADVANECGF